jgi:hypothetical protein
MKDWKSLEQDARCAKAERDKRRVHFRIIQLLERVSLEELKQIVGAAEDEFLKEQAEVELWWRHFDKKPKNLINLIRTSKNTKKIRNAIIELGNLACRDAISTVIGFLDNIDLRDAAAMALRKMPTQEAFEPLIQSIRRYPHEGPECLLYALEVLDCSDAAELLVDLFIPEPDAIVVRDDIYRCFESKAVKLIPKDIKTSCCSKLRKAIENASSKDDDRELRQLLELVDQVKTV